MSLIHIIEEQVREKRIELSQNDVQRERMTREYGQLRQMLHALVMDVEVGGVEALRNDGSVAEIRPNVVTPLAPVPMPMPVTIDPREPVAEVDSVPAKDAKPSRRKRTKAENGTTGVGAAGTGAAGTGAEELRAGLKRMLKKKRAQEAEATPVPAE